MPRCGPWARRRRRRGRIPRCSHARGWLRYLIASDPRGASLKLSAAAQAGPPAERALALAGLGEIAEDRTDSTTAARHFIAALQAAPWIRSPSSQRCGCSTWKASHRRSTS